MNIIHNLGLREEFIKVFGNNPPPFVEPAISYLGLFLAIVIIFFIFMEVFFKNFLDNNRISRYAKVTFQSLTGT